MKETGIIMSGDHPKKILDGTKTMTRRVIKPCFKWDEVQKRLTIHAGKCGEPIECFADAYGCRTCGEFHWDNSLKCPFGQVGDRLWVRETWMLFGFVAADSVFIHYKASEETNGGECLLQRHTDKPLYPSLKYRSARFMPRAYSRITLEITEVRVERVQEITEEDARAEGALCHWKEGDEQWKLALDLVNPTMKDAEVIGSTHTLGFRILWDSINAKRGYDYDEEDWGCPELQDGFYMVRFEPSDEYQRIYLWNSKRGITWGWNEQDDPEALELDIRQPELIDIIDSQGIHHQLRKLVRKVRTKGIYSWQSNPWVWIISFNLVGNG